MKLWRVISYFLAFSIGAFCLSGIVFAADDVKTIEVERLVLKDKEGAIRAELVMDGDVAIFRMFDVEGAKRVELGVGYSPSLVFYPPPSLVFYPPTGQPEITAINAVSWNLLALKARENTCGWALTNKINKLSFDIYLLDPPIDGVRLRAFVNTDTQPSWSVHKGGGAFSVSDREVKAAYLEAGRYVLDNIIWPAVSGIHTFQKSDVEILFFIRGYEVGLWRNGVMKLTGE